MKSRDLGSDTKSAVINVATEQSMDHLRLSKNLEREENDVLSSSPHFCGLERQRSFIYLDSFTQRRFFKFSH